MTATHSKFDVVIVGGGFGGISVAARLHRVRPQLTVAVIEPSDRHYYQPAWTLVGGGAYRIQSTCRSEEGVIPRGFAWIRARCAGFEPALRQVSLEDGSAVRYRMLVVAAGLQCNWKRVEGLSATLGKNGVSSNYAYEHAPYTWECLRQWRGGHAVFIYLLRTPEPKPIELLDDRYQVQVESVRLRDRPRPTRCAFRDRCILSRSRTNARALDAVTLEPTAREGRKNAVLEELLSRVSLKYVVQEL
ncbi:MAG: NAD(P)/FAD-dependent oxidoreductase [Steroidobacteraceae bacterium]